MAACSFTLTVVTLQNVSKFRTGQKWSLQCTDPEPEPEVSARSDRDVYVCKRLNTRTYYIPQQ